MIETELPLAAQEEAPIVASGINDNTDVVAWKI
jgi:hypothetical protein